jgi:hypothetical protein
VRKEKRGFDSIIYLELVFDTLQGLADTNKPPELISPNMTGGELLLNFIFFTAAPACPSK